jgi:1-acyl-sn-glycerol-3-phosphate acyltransferase
MHGTVDSRELEGRSRVAERKASHARHATQVGPLYDAVAFGMWAQIRASFRVEVLGPRRFRLDPGTLIVATHRRESDVPVISPLLYFRARLWRHRSEVMRHAARDDMFLPGFFAGFPPGLRPWVRRLLYPVGVGRFLPWVGVHPISSASTARAGELLRELPDALLAEVLPGELADAFSARAGERGLPTPVRGRDVLRGDYADLLWQAASPDGSPSLEDFWARRAARAAADFRELVDFVRAGGSLVVFPEGRPSPDGDVGPLRRGLGALVRRGRPAWFLPVAVAYDPLGSGRTRAFVSFARRVEPPTDDVEEATLSLLKRAMPLTCGQFVAHELLAGRTPDEPALADAVEEAWAQERPVDPHLLDRGRRVARLAEALAAAERRPAELPFLAREYESARAL